MKWHWLERDIDRKIDKLIGTVDSQSEYMQMVIAGEPWASHQEFESNYRMSRPGLWPWEMRPNQEMREKAFCGLCESQCEDDDRAVVVRLTVAPITHQGRDLK